VIAIIRRDGGGGGGAPGPGCSRNSIMSASIVDADERIEYLMVCRAMAADGVPFALTSKTDFITLSSLPGAIMHISVEYLCRGEHPTAPGIPSARCASI
jgi:hypothetical protein